MPRDFGLAKTMVGGVSVTLASTIHAESLPAKQIGENTHLYYYVFADIIEFEATGKY